MRIMLLLETIMWKSLIFFLFSQTWFWLCPRKVLFQTKPCMANLLIRNRRIILKGSLNWNTINRSSPRSSQWGITYIWFEFPSFSTFLVQSLFFSVTRAKKEGEWLVDLKLPLIQQTKNSFNHDLPGWKIFQALMEPLVAFCQRCLSQ